MMVPVQLQAGNCLYFPKNLAFLASLCFRDVWQYMFVVKNSVSNSGQKGCGTVSTHKTAKTLIFTCFVSL